MSVHEFPAHSGFAPVAAIQRGNAPAPPGSQAPQTHGSPPDAGSGRPWLPRTLRGRLTVLVLGAMLPAAAMAVWAATRADRQELAGQQARLTAAAAAVVHEQQGALIAVRALLSSLAALEEVRGFGPGCGAIAVGASTALRDIGVAAVGVVDGAGRWRCASFPLESAPPVPDRRWFRELLAGRAWVISELHDSRVLPTRGFVAAVPFAIDTPAGEGGIAVFVEAERFAESRPRSILGEHGVVALVDRDDHPVIAEQDPNGITAALPSDPAVLVRAAASGEYPEAKGADGVRRIYAVQDLFGGELRVLAGVPAPEIYGTLNERLLRRFALPLLMLLSAAAVTWLGVDRLLIRRVRELRALTHHYATGSTDPQPVAEAGAPRELGELSSDIAQMAGALVARERELRESLAHQELLIREVHHRVRNNLQTVMSLLSLHARRAATDDDRRVFRDANARIGALALVHRRLYETGQLEQVDMKGFLEDLCADLRSSNPAGTKEIDLRVCSDSMLLASGFAMPIGLLVNEAVTNAYKHAFADRDRGRIEVALRAAHRPGEFILTIEDDGRGGDAGSEGKGLGTALIRGFVQQLGGSLQIVDDRGRRIIVVFTATIAP